MSSLATKEIKIQCPVSVFKVSCFKSKLSSKLILGGILFRNLSTQLESKNYIIKRSPEIHKQCVDIFVFSFFFMSDDSCCLCGVLSFSLLKRPCPSGLIPYALLIHFYFSLPSTIIAYIINISFTLFLST